MESAMTDGVDWEILALGALGMLAMIGFPLGYVMGWRHGIDASCRVIEAKKRQEIE